MSSQKNTLLGYTFHGQRQLGNSVNVERTWMVEEKRNYLLSNS